ncbi:MAG: acyl carrier protein [Micromonosporaceae bacterium]
MSVQDDIRRYIVDEIGWTGDVTTLTDDLDLIGQRVIDSLSVVELSTLLEQWYGIQVDAAELVYRNFSSIGAIAEFVAAKRIAVS